MRPQRTFFNWIWGKLLFIKNQCDFRWRAKPENILFNKNDFEEANPPSTTQFVHHIKDHLPISSHIACSDAE